VRVALCDNFNTPQAMQELRGLISAGNQYYTEKQKQGGRVHQGTFQTVGKYISKMMGIFGVLDTAKPQGAADSLMPVVQAMSVFRDSVRKLAQEGAPAAEILQVCDKLRDEDLVEHGVLLEDREGPLGCI
jgi:cysteinyl-tRNA synthetase